MNFRRTAWGVGLLGALALLGCGGDDTPTPDGREGEAGITGAGGAGNDASVVSDSSTGKAGGSANDSTVACKKTDAMLVGGAAILMCKAAVAEAGPDGGAGASCAACLCTNCPLEAMPCNGDPTCVGINDCCRAACGQCAPPAPEGGSDAPTSEGGGNDEASTSDGPAAE